MDDNYFHNSPTNTQKKTPTRNLFHIPRAHVPGDRDAERPPSQALGPPAPQHALVAGRRPGSERPPHPRRPAQLQQRARPLLRPADDARRQVLHGLRQSRRRPPRVRRLRQGRVPAHRRQVRARDQHVGGARDDEGGPRTFRHRRAQRQGLRDRR